jgi:N-acetylmuramoyl-L-alanine amidase
MENYFRIRFHLKFSLLVLLLALIVPFSFVKAEEGDTKTLNVKYQTHIENVGWQYLIYDGQMSGTSGKSLRLEGIKISLESSYPNVKVMYQTNIQNIGWQDWVEDGQMSGTSGKSLRLEAIRIKMQGAPVGYHIQYQVHVQNVGWQDWIEDGDVAGTVGQSLRLEGIRIRVVREGSVAKGGQGIKYETHVENDGWQNSVFDSQLSGTQGRSLRLEGIKISLQNPPEGMKIKYQTHVQNVGWQPFSTNGELSGTSGMSYRLEGIKIVLENAPKDYHILYQVHVQNIGWQEWKKDGEMAGTEGKALRLEAIRIKLVKSMPGEPLMDIEAPKLNESLQNNIEIKGWSLNASKVKAVNVYLNSKALGKADINIDRLDVKEQYNLYPSSEKSGFKYKLDLTNLPNGFYEVTIESVGENNTSISKKLYFKKMGQDILLTTNKLPIIAIDIGHNVANNDGAVGIRKEDDLTKEVGTKVINKLREQGYIVVETLPKTAESQKDSLQKRVDTANNAKADLFVSIHFNAGGGQGSEVYIISNEALARAQKVLDNIVALGYANRGVKTADYYVIKNTNMPSMLIECAFVDSQVDMQRYDAEKLANSIVNGILLK